MNSWDKVLKEEYKKKYFIDLKNFIKNAYANDIVYPKKDDVFKALRLTKYDNLKVVILGQDPYHGENEANGLAFSVYNDVTMPPSLRNIFKELKDDLNITRTNSDLSDWASQGVLLLNSILTVKKDSPLSHSNVGWEIFTDSIIKKINERDDSIVFILWGNFARSKKTLIDSKHYIIESAHPSPLSASRGFFGSKPFSKTNTYLKKIGKEEIKW